MFPKLLHRFYGSILLLETLGQVRGDRRKAEIISNEPGLHNRRLRHHFCNALAYICAFDTGSDHVTAIALDAQPGITKVLIAANRGVPNEVFEFLQDILSILHSIAKGSPDEEIVDAQDNILHKVVSLNQPRIRRYHEVAVEMYESCGPIMQSARKELGAKVPGHPRVSELDRVGAFLNRFFTSGKSLKDEYECLDLVKQCHGLRYSGMIDTLDSFAAHGQSCQSKFQRLQELLKKLGKHATCSRRLVSAAKQLPEEFTGNFEVIPIEPSSPSPICLPLKKASVESIIGRMTPDKASQEMMENMLKQRLDQSTDEITQGISEKLKTKTLIHAELLLMSYIEEHGCNFIEPDDKYIGCSKPACYLCSLYICHHPGNYSLPDTSNKLYIKWRMPDTYSSHKSAARSAREMEVILDKMIQEIKKNFKTDVMRPRPRNMHADSSADMTTTVDGAAMGAGDSGLQPIPMDLQSHIEALSLYHTLYTQSLLGTTNYFPNASPQPEQHQPPPSGHLESQFQYSYPYIPQIFRAPIPVPFPSPIPEIPSSSASFAQSHVSTPLYPSSISGGSSGGSRNYIHNNNNSNSSSGRGGTVSGRVSQPTSDIASLNSGREQQNPNPQKAAKRPGWRGPPSQRWVSAHH
ncbi:conserved hypothetical protein [Histoplasma capsulatum G186AR]|uniref:Uncharacterized protein n=2 Tax=Ajellomyces capsulatus TaxID=5037 RepID=C0NSP7_AJECG|nr:uncharacterized protein HCBG_06177 [Histoplasma capsulatum G186AR]EEH05913.1 conserved hypothetical protein [Histoplasma capsulatum G186AR]